MGDTPLPRIQSICWSEAPPLEPYSRYRLLGARALLGDEGPAWGWCGSALQKSGFLHEETEGAMGGQGAMKSP